MLMRLCVCGSGEQKYELRDAAGIFCCYVCSACEEEKRKGYNPAIFDDSAPYASSGEEADLWLDSVAASEESACAEQYDAHCYIAFDDYLFRISCIFTTHYGSQLFLLSDCFGGTTTRDVLRS